MIGPMSSPGSTPQQVFRQVFRQRSSLLLAGVCAVTGVLLLLSLARNWSSFPRPLNVAWVTFGLALTWAIFVRPAVVLDDRGVTLRNVLRDVHVPWARLTDVTSRWNVKVFAGDKGYGAWAISSQVERPKRVSSGGFGRRSAALPQVTNVHRAPHPTVVTKVSTRSVADSIKAAKQEYDEALALGRSPESGTSVSGVASGAEVTGEDLVRVRWVPVVIVVLSAAAVAVLGLTYLG
jgi:Bacterial PH domain